jgi:nucleoside 2-deoxyribosyltransferase
MRPAGDSPPPARRDAATCSALGAFATDDRMKLYLAGPLFSTAEREFNVRLAELLRQKGHQVWLPQELEQRSMSARQIFTKDVEGIDWAEAVVANMDGPDPDSGTCWECGYAYGKKPVIVYRTDFRDADEADKAPFNLMLTESATRCLDLRFADTARVAAAIDDALKSLAA